MSKNKRIRWIDTARGVGIILVTLIHSSTYAIRSCNFGTDLLYNFTVAVAVPIMIFLSGYAVSMSREKYESMTFEAFVKKKFYSLMLQYLVYSLLIYILFTVAGVLPGFGVLISRAGYGGMGILEFIRGILVGNNEYSIHVWFLYALFLYEIIAYMVFKYIRNTGFFVLISIITLIVTLSYYMSVMSISLAWANGISYFSYFAFGILFSGKNFGKISGVISFFCWMSLFFINMFVIRHNTLIHDIIGIIIPFFAIAAVSYFSGRIKGNISDKMAVLGRQSMAVYLFQQPFFGSALGTILYTVLHIPAWVAVLCCAVASLCIPLIIRLIFIKYAWFGKLFAIK